MPNTDKVNTPTCHASHFFATPRTDTLSPSHVILYQQLITSTAFIARWYLSRQLRSMQCGGWRRAARRAMVLGRRAAPGVSTLNETVTIPKAEYERLRAPEEMADIQAALAVEAGIDRVRPACRAPVWYRAARRGSSDSRWRPSSLRAAAPSWIRRCAAHRRPRRRPCGRTCAPPVCSTPPPVPEPAERGGGARGRLTAFKAVW